MPHFSSPWVVKTLLVSLACMRCVVSCYQDQAPQDNPPMGALEKIPLQVRVCLGHEPGSLPWPTAITMMMGIRDDRDCQGYQPTKPVTFFCESCGFGVSRSITRSSSLSRYPYKEAVRDWCGMLCCSAGHSLEESGLVRDINRDHEGEVFDLE